MAVGKRYKGHSDFVKTVVCVNISGKDVRPKTSSDYASKHRAGLTRWTTVLD